METEAKPPTDPDLSETTENYLKRIYILIQENDKARISDIADLMGRSLSSVSEAVKRMSEDGYLNYEKYGKITLTDRGKEVAENVHSNYEILNDLLSTLGVSKDVAVLDACSMEHSIHEETVETISRFVEFANKNEKAKELLEEFHKSRQE